MSVLGRLPWSSNATFLVDISLAGETVRAVYKPGRGERPLWDYPTGLYRRERGVYLVSEVLGWGLVPETVLRDGEFGPGSVQRFVDADFEEHYFSLLENARHHEALQALALLDAVVNNGDRKSGHFLLDADHRIWGIDHGLCLHDENKLRTVAWDFAGRPLPSALVPDLDRLAAQVSGGGHLPELAELTELRGLLLPEEVTALAGRARALARRPVFPPPRSSRSYPWPLV